MSCPGNVQCAYETLPIPCPTHRPRDVDALELHAQECTKTAMLGCPLCIAFLTLKVGGSRVKAHATLDRMIDIYRDVLRDAKDPATDPACVTDTATSSTNRQRRLRAFPKLTALRARRLAAGVTVAELSVASELSSFTISVIERDQSASRPDQIEAHRAGLAKILADRAGGDAVFTAAENEALDLKGAMTMSWSVQFEGTSEVVRQQFDTEIERSRSNHMIAAELEEMGQARDFVVALAKKHTELAGNANGHWIVYGEDDARNKFGGLTITTRQFASVLQQ